MTIFFREVNVRKAQNNFFFTFHCIWLSSIAFPQTALCARTPHHSISFCFREALLQQQGLPIDSHL